MKEKCNCKNPKCTCGPGCKCTEPCTCGLDEYEKTAIENLVLDLESARVQAEENLNLAKYQKAEFENYKKRNNASIENAFNDGKIFVVVNVLPVLDSLTEAMKIITDAQAKEGIDILYRKFESILTSIGLEEIKSLGEKFDPYIHNAVLTEKVEGKPSGVVTEEWQKGYKLGVKVIRPATVKVSE